MNIHHSFQGSKVVDFRISNEKFPQEWEEEVRVGVFPDFRPSIQGDEWLAGLTTEVKLFTKESQVCYVKHNAVYILKFDNAFVLNDNLTNTTFIKLLADLYQNSLSEINNYLEVHTKDSDFSEHIATIPEHKMINLIKVCLSRGINPN